MDIIDSRGSPSERSQRTDTDIPALADMLYALNAHHAADLPGRFHTEGDAPALRTFFVEKLGQGARILLYRTEGVPRAYLMWQVLDHAATALEHPRRQALLDHIHVQPIWRHRGLARRLIARFEIDSAAEGCTGWITRVHAFNTPSAALMRGAGAHLAVETYEKRL
ncbi:GNAT family N-acetyltransferase [Antarctobacter heliothermus]|uniref:Acetyltransferase (GNAT) family protein n=1 Tax=Antarctobacter heliothermus TaxID=74033 RepID=A0A239K2S3_9RHOB|nr:GNAT family N-acetyltransferase [Antarctobacter heliothermus]SNT11903.1 Acetyltransferase (GNAT) family protein [Antarctobacter heliothermus]